ncbi:hypothetical protein PROVRETT_07168 [Providencia rettgeri DSM 1131]|nr:hypothetical protein PROVRETT_07168 [Providencia rettgeri DSM 1131]
MSRPTVIISQITPLYQLNNILLTIYLANAKSLFSPFLSATQMREFLIFSV